MWVVRQANMSEGKHGCVVHFGGTKVRVSSRLKIAVAWLGEEDILSPWHCVVCDVQGRSEGGVRVGVWVVGFYVWCDVLGKAFLRGFPAKIPGGHVWVPSVTHVVGAAACIGIRGGIRDGFTLKPRFSGQAGGHRLGVKERYRPAWFLVWDTGIVIGLG